MEHRPLGRTGVQISELCLGTMRFGAWSNTDHDDSIRIIHRALDAGISFIDTADVYSAGESEEIPRQGTQGPPRGRRARDEGVGSMDDDLNHRGNSRRWIVTEVEKSLRRLGTDWIDLHQIHHPDPNTDVEETLGALTDLVRQGKLRYTGSSSFSGSQHRARRAADAKARRGVCGPEREEPERRRATPVDDRVRVVNRGP